MRFRRCPALTMAQKSRTEFIGKIILWILICTILNRSYSVIDTVSTTEEIRFESSHASTVSIKRRDVRWMLQFCFLFVSILFRFCLVDQSLGLRNKHPNLTDPNKTRRKKRETNTKWVGNKKGGKRELQAETKQQSISRSTLSSTTSKKEYKSSVVLLGQSDVAPVSALRPRSHSRVC